MITFDEDIHCRGCAGRGEHPRREGDWCPECGGSGYKEIQISSGPMSRYSHVIVAYLPAAPGKPYSGPVRAGCGRRLAGLGNVTWIQPGEAERHLDCPGCLRYVQGILAR